MDTAMDDTGTGRTADTAHQAVAFSVPGVDITRVADIATSIDIFGERYLASVFTAAERAAADHLQGAARLEHLAGRFAAKEAVFKALRHPRDVPLPWRDIEIVTAAQGFPQVWLHAGASAWAAECGIHAVEVSISHEAELAVAMAVATGHTRPAGPSQGGRR